MLLGTHDVELELVLTSYLSISYLYDLGHFYYTNAAPLRAAPGILLALSP